MIFKRVASLSIFAIFILSPFLGMLVSRIPINIGGVSITGAIKELLQAVAIFSLVFLVLAQDRIFKSYIATIVFIFLLVMFFTILRADNLSLYFEAFRLQFGYIIIFILLLITRCDIMDVDLLLKVISIQFFIVLIVGFLEYLNPAIITLLYGIPKAEMSNVTLAIGDRLISTMENPINLGAFLCIGIVAFYCFFKENRFFHFYFWPIWGLCLLEVGFTFSRTAVIAYVFVSLIILMDRVKNRDVGIFVIMLLPILGWGVFGFNFEIDISAVVDRLSILLSGDAISGNQRVYNWNTAFGHFKSFDDYLFGLGLGISNPTFDKGGLIIENSFLTYFIDGGIIGSLIYLIINIIFLFKIIKIKTKAKLFLFCFYLVFFIFSLANDFNRNFPFVFYYWMLFYIVCFDMKKNINDEVGFNES
ncbi:O-antigen ligase family protein [Serratia sp. 2723]|uniref:O-antigen ligase family protein n=1 Tax=unclassified Serratia (in: enterobacteria) TaxID=2647522 RepID=UPI003D23BF6C